jgi:hypothetical protein
MGLLVLSYIGTILVGSGKVRGLPSGIEFIGLGFVVGPTVLGLVDRPLIAGFGPIIDAALGWHAFIIGLDFGRVEGRRVVVREMALGTVGALLTGLLVAVAVWKVRASGALPGIGVADGVVLAAGAGAVCAETAGQTVEWVQGRWGAEGPVSQFLRHISAADDLVPLVAAGAIFSLVPHPALTISPPAWGLFAASVALGVLLGLVNSMLLRGVDGDAAWGALIGTLLLVVGAAARLGLCTIFVTFVTGITLAATSPSRQALREMVGRTENAIVYPMLLLAGARIDLRPLLESGVLMTVLPLALLTRGIGKLWTGALIRTVAPAARPAGLGLGTALLSSSPLSASCGLVLALRFPGPVGDTLLVCAVGSAILGELISTLALKRLLVRTGEITIAAPRAVEPSVSALSSVSAAGVGLSILPSAPGSALSVGSPDPGNEHEGGAP